MAEKNDSGLGAGTAAAAAATTAAPSSSQTRPAIRADMRPPMISRRDLMDEDPDDYYIDPDRIPPGMTYEWKRIEIFGKPDVKNTIKMDQFGWTPVPAKRHPELFGAHFHDDRPGVRDAMMLMERPTEYTRSARVWEYQKAQKNVADQSKKLGLSTNTMMPRLRPKTGRSYEPVEIPSDAAPARRPGASDDVG